MRTFALNQYPAETTDGEDEMDADELSEKTGYTLRPAPVASAPGSSGVPENAPAWLPNSKTPGGESNRPTRNSRGHGTKKRTRETSDMGRVASTPCLLSESFEEAVGDGASRLRFPKGVAPRLRGNSIPPPLKVNPCFEKMTPIEH